MKNDVSSKWLLTEEVLNTTSKANALNLRECTGMHMLTSKHWALVVMK